MANAHIINFIQSLGDEEIKSAEDYIRKVLSACKANSVESKQLLLFKYITVNRDKNISESEILKITETKNAASLKLCLYETVTEALTLNKNISNKNIFSEQHRRFYKLKKKLLFLRIFDQTQNQKRIDTTQYLLNEIINEAREYQIYEVLVEALTVKKYTNGIRAGTEEFNKINKEIIFYDNCYKAVYYACDCYYQLVSNDNLAKSFSKKELNIYFQLSIKQMEIDHKKTKSQLVAYYLLIIRFALCEREKEYTQGIKLCNELILLIRNSKVLYRKERIGSILANLSLFKNHMGNYRAAAIDAKNAQSHYIKNSLDYITTKEQEFRAHFYDNNKLQAQRCAEELLKHSIADTGKFRKSKYVYYHSCVLFTSKNFKQALEILKPSLEIEKDKGGWNISLRILKIMIYIELNKTDEAERALESLRKYIGRMGKTDEIKPRDLLIVKLLKELEKDNFEFRSKNINVSKMQKELSEKDSPVSWEHYTPELIPFHKWLEEKISD